MNLDISTLNLKPPISPWSLIYPSLHPLTPNISLLSTYTLSLPHPSLIHTLSPKPLPYLHNFPVALNFIISFKISFPIYYLISPAFKSFFAGDTACKSDNINSINGIESLSQNQIYLSLYICDLVMYIIWSNRIHSLKYLRPKILECKD